MKRNRARSGSDAAVSVEEVRAQTDRLACGLPQPYRFPMALAPVIAALRAAQLLLKQDQALPNVVSVVIGEPLSTSWWSHPRAKEIYAALEQLAERSDVIETKLIAGKVTFVLAPLWPALLGVASCREPWQLTGLSAAAKTLLVRAEQTSELEASGAPLKELERRLLVRTEQRHTAAGKHVLVLESWARFAVQRKVTALGVAESKAALEHAAMALGAPRSALPWHVLRGAARASVRRR